MLTKGQVGPGHQSRGGIAFVGKPCPWVSTADGTRLVVRFIELRPQLVVEAVLRVMVATW